MAPDRLEAEWGAPIIPDKATEVGSAPTDRIQPIIISTAELQVITVSPEGDSPSDPPLRKIGNRGDGPAPFGPAPWPYHRELGPTPVPPENNENGLSRQSELNVSGSDVQDDSHHSLKDEGLPTPTARQVPARKAPDPLHQLSRRRTILAHRPPSHHEALTQEVQRKGPLRRVARALGGIATTWREHRKRETGGKTGYVG